MKSLGVSGWQLQNISHRHCAGKERQRIHLGRIAVIFHSCHLRESPWRQDPLCICFGLVVVVVALFCFFVFFSDRIWLGAQAVLELTTQPLKFVAILLPHSPRYWDSRCELPCPAWTASLLSSSKSCCHFINLALNLTTQINWKVPSNPWSIEDYTAGYSAIPSPQESQCAYKQINKPLPLPEKHFSFHCGFW